MYKGYLEAQFATATTRFPNYEYWVFQQSNQNKIGQPYFPTETPLKPFGI